MSLTCGILELLLGERRFGKCQREIIRNLNYIDLLNYAGTDR